MACFPSHRFFLFPSLFLFFAFWFNFTVFCQQSEPVLFTNVRIFEADEARLSAASDVLVRDGRIAAINPAGTATNLDGRVIAGEDRVLIPGLIDVHVHLTFGSLAKKDLFDKDLTPERVMVLSGKQAEAMLLRGFTSVRDVGGPIFDLKAAIDRGQLRGPKIWPAGAVISQTSGHGDFRTPDERSRRFFGMPSRAELLGATFIADGRDEVLTAVRENLRSGAALIKLMAGGGTSSAYDPIDVTQYTLDEMRAAVEAAEDWGTYVTVHAYTARAVERAVDAGVKCIEHGQLLERPTLRKLKRKDVWLSMQVLMKSSEAMDAARIEKRRGIIENQPKVWEAAAKMKLKVAWGTDFLFEPEQMPFQNEYLVKVGQWYSPAEVLRIATARNADLLALSGLRSPYSAEVGRIRVGAAADLILVKGNPLEDLSIIADPEENFLLIMQDGKVVKDLMN